MKKHTEIKQTALQWFAAEIAGHLGPAAGEELKKIYEQALEKEEEQIIDAWHDGYFNGAEEGSTTLGENYYADNYGFLR
jgi:hypothetical protein